MISALALAAPAAASAAPERPVAAQVVTSPTAAPVKAQASDTAGYAEREQQDTQAANYEGGNVVIIGTSGGVLVVLLLILLLI